MAANKFIHRNTNKITFVLIYAVLEWTLILLLLINSLFSFMIIKFSQLFGLKSPCLWCSTLHRFFEPQKVNIHRDLLCEFHSKEVSVLGFCPSHKKLAEIKDFCEDCFSCHLDFQVKHSEAGDEYENKLKCSCCGLKLQKKHAESETCLNQFEEKLDSTSDFLPQDLEFFFDYSGSQLVPIELIDSEESQSILEANQEQDHEFGDYQKADVIIQEHHTAGLEAMELEETENSIVFQAKFSESKEKSDIVNEEVQEITIDTKKPDPTTHFVDKESEVSLETKINVLETCVEEFSSKSHDLHLKIENGFLESKNSSETCNKNEEEKVPDTTTSIKKLFMFERKESRAEESLDGSLMSEVEGGDPVNTTEKLKSALRVLKAELEEERSASAIAASETTAMITRLQEEKAAMQMEALQYQRMMEEQSEYDQEALQLLNELMIKKEKELEMYKNKVADYEAKDRMIVSKGSMKKGSCLGSASSSHSEYENGMAIENTDEWNGNQESWNQNVLELETSLADFEEERLSIFEQIKVLEEKLFVLSDEEDQHFEDVRHIEDLYEGNGFHSDDMVIKANGFPSNELENGNKRMGIEYEVDQVYERLQALEADREFLKHCVGSLNKGKKGMELLREILQHLRNLRTADFRR
ncbi:myosin-binding protein 3-like [Bidens hawaiensis]|uniref:myosin-binding protein 3-like n=1 Tax=Bidens hawaiensis TaxID=980011 RepID=UPI00404A0B1D